MELFRKEVDITVLVTDQDLNVLGDPITEWIDIDLTVRFNEPGSGYVVLPANSNVRALVTGGNRLVAIRNGDVFLAGPIEKYTFYQSDDAEGSGTGEMSVWWSDDLAYLAGRVTYPNPALAADVQDTDRWTFNGNAEVAMRALVDDNAGPSALSARQVPALSLGTLAGVGSNVEVSTRFEPLTEALRSIAVSGGGLGFRTRHTATGILFEVYQPADLSGDVRFGFSLGNMRSLILDVVAPSLSAAIVGGQGEGTSRTIVERLNAAAVNDWGRLEAFLDHRGSETTTELEQRGDAELDEQAETVRLATITVDTQDQQFGRDFGLGDRVSVVAWPGREVNDLVRTVHIQATPRSGEIVTSYVGSQAGRHEPEWVKKMRNLDRRMSYLEANAEVPAGP